MVITANEAAKMSKAEHDKLPVDRLEPIFKLIRDYAQMGATMATVPRGLRFLFDFGDLHKKVLEDLGFQVKTNLTETEVYIKWESAYADLYVNKNK